MATPFPFTAGAVLTAAQLNAIGEWIDYTPTWTNVTVGNATQDFRYLQVNKGIFVIGVFTVGSTTTFGGGGSPANFTLPLTANTPLGRVGNAIFLDSGTETYNGVVNLLSTTTAQPRSYAVLGSLIKDNSIINTVPFTWTTNDAIYVDFYYEAA